MCFGFSTMISSRILFRKQQLYLETKLPVRAKSFRSYGVIVGCQLNIQRKLAEFYDFSYTSAHRHGPHFVMAGLPISGEYRGRGKIPAAVEVIIDERLNQHPVDVFISPTGE